MAAVRRVLVIEHDAEVRASLLRSLARSGADVTVASDLGDGLCRLGAGDAPSVVLVDLRRARAAGPAFVRALRADPRLAEVPVITMTGEGGGRLRGRGATALDVDELVSIVLSLCEEARCA